MRFRDAATNRYKPLRRCARNSYQRTIEVVALAVAVGAAVSLCLVVAWPAQQTVVPSIARAVGGSLTGDDLGDYTMSFVFPIVLTIGSWGIYRFAMRRLTKSNPIGPRAETGRSTTRESLTTSTRRPTATPPISNRPDHAATEGAEEMPA
jgi:hypothetical protein